MSRPRLKQPNFELIKLTDRENYYISWTEGGSKRVSTGKSDKGEAERAFQIFLKQYNAPAESEKNRISFILESYLDFKKLEHKEKGYKKNLHQSLVFALKPIFKFFEHLYVEDIDRELIRKYRASKLHLSNATVKKSLDIFVAALNHAYKEEWINKVPHIEKPTPPPPRDFYLKPAEAKRFLNSCTITHLRLFVLLALHTLSRKGAILELEWNQVDLDNNLINFNPPGRTRTKKKRVPVPINKTLKTALLQAQQLATTDYVVEYGGKPVIDIKRSFANAAKSANLEWVTPHVIRHTGATIMAQHGVTMWEIAGIMGDRLLTVEQHYAKHSPDYLKGAVSKLDELYG